MRILTIIMLWLLVSCVSAETRDAITRNETSLSRLDRSIQAIEMQVEHWHDLADAGSSEALARVDDLQSRLDSLRAEQAKLLEARKNLEERAEKEVVESKDAVGATLEAAAPFLQGLGAAGPVLTALVAAVGASLRRKKNA